MKTLQELKSILSKNQNKKIMVIGTTCTGKSTFLRQIPEGIEIGELAPSLTEEEKDFYYHAPLTKENNNKMITMVAKKAFVKAGQPVFGTAIANGTELVVYLTIDDELLKKRAVLRGVDFAYAKRMQEFIEEEVRESGLPVIKIKVRE